MRIHENDREGLARLCRYALRPPLALQRLQAGPEGRLVYRMKRPRDGSQLLLLTPDELIAKLAALVPPPRSHALRFHGLFAPNSRHRRRVVPAAAPSPTAAGESLATAAPAEPARPAPPPFALESPPAVAEPTARAQRIPWAELLRRDIAIDVLDCPRCHGRLELIAFIAEAGLARRILDHLGARLAGAAAHARARRRPRRGRRAPRLRHRSRLRRVNRAAPSDGPGLVRPAGSVAAPARPVRASPAVERGLNQ